MLSLVITGFIRHARYLARLLNAEAADVRAACYADDRASVLRAAAHALSADVSITFGGPEPKAVVRAICEARRRPVIHIWAGSDVLTLARSTADIETLRLLNVVHWASGLNLVGELASLGIDAKYVPLASAPVPETLAAMPHDFTVLTYLPVPRREFYAQSHIWRAARELPDVRFIAVGPGLPEPGAPPNLKYVGEVRDMAARIDGASVLLRIPQHDSLSQGVIEALARGRHVIWTYDHPGVIGVGSPDEAIRELVRLRERHRKGELSVNRVGADYVAARHDPQRIARGVLDTIHSTIRRARENAEGNCRPTRVAVSGSPAFSARVAENCRTYGRQLAPTLLRTHTTSDTAVSLMTLLKSAVWYSIGRPAVPRSLEFAAYVSRKRRIIHWLANDVDALAGDLASLRRYRSTRFVHLAQDASVAERLYAMGLNARITSLAALPRVETIRPLPSVFTLLLYVPAERPEQYGKFQYERLMRELSKEPLRYIIVGGGAIEVPAGVCAEHVAWRHDLGDVYERSTALVRFTQDDSISAMVIEALLHGRHVLWSNEFPYVVHLRHFHDLERAVRLLLERHLKGTLAPQADAADAIRKRYSPEDCIRRLAEACG